MNMILIINILTLIINIITLINMIKITINLKNINNSRDDVRARLNRYKSIHSGICKEGTNYAEDDKRWKETF